MDGYSPIYFYDVLNVYIDIRERYKNVGGRLWRL